MEKSKYEKLKIQTHNATLVWKEVRGIADSKVADKMDIAMLEWIDELTNTLSIWIDKGKDMSIGELILARVNLGALVESWLKFFYCVFYVDYLKKPMVSKKGKMLEPENMQFEQLKTFSIGILWDNISDKEYIWVDKIQNTRNSIHIFKYRDIGNTEEFINDIEQYYDFVTNILKHFPPVEEYLSTYPAGYIMEDYIY